VPREGVQLAATDMQEVCAVNTVGLHKLSTQELLCTVNNPGQKSIFQRMCGTNIRFCFSYRGSLTTRTEYQG